MANFTRNSHIGQVRAEIAPRLKEINTEMYEALKLAEWQGNLGERVCPVCRRMEVEEHKKDCVLANALAKADGKVGA